MAPTTSEVQNGTAKHLESPGSMFEIEDPELARLLDRPRHVNIERKRSFDERSFSDMSISSPRAFPFDGTYSPGRRSGFGTPRSCNFEPHPIIGEAWESLRRSLVYFRGQPVGTIAALDHSSEELNYDQVSFHSFGSFSSCFPPFPGE